MPFNYYEMESNAKDEEKRYNLLTYNLPYTDRCINKAFDEYFERKCNEKMYGYPFIEKEVLKNKNGEYLLYDPDESRFVKDTNCLYSWCGWLATLNFNTDWVKKIDIKRDKPYVETTLDTFLKKSLYNKYQILKSLKYYLDNVSRYVEINYD